MSKWEERSDEEIEFLREATGRILDDVKGVNFIGDVVRFKRHEPVIRALRELDFQDAERLCLKALDSNDNDPLMWTLLALVYLNTGDGDSANECLDRAEDLDNGLALTWTVAGLFSAAIGEEEYARLYLLRSLVIDPLQVYPSRIACGWLMEAGAYEKAVEILLALVEMTPEDEGTWGNMERCLTGLSDLDDARKIAAELVKKHKRNYLSWYTYGAVLATMKKWKKAEKAFRNALKLDKTDPDVYTYLGAVLSATGREQSAARVYRKATRIDPQNVTAWMNLGITQAKLRNLTEANNAIRRAVALDPDFAQAVQSYLLRGG